MLLSFKTLVTEKSFFLSSRRTTVSVAKQSLSDTSRFFAGDCRMSAANIHACKIGPSPSKKLLYLLQWKLFKNDEKCFNFILNTLLVCKTFRILSRLFGHIKKTASRFGSQTITIQILPSITRKCNQTMKFGHVIEYNTSNIFL